MNERYCKQADCDIRTGCIFGEVNPNDCPHRESVADSAAAKDNSETPVPWHGSAFGITELQFVAARGRPKVIGIIGEHNAGKTTFLTSLYLMLFHGKRMPGKSFAGSFTLRAWEELANHLRYPTGTAPMFPRHTPVTKDRVPGLLHLAFRNDSNRLEDFVFTDAPGEWFSNWAKDRNSEGAKGARWVAEHADRFVLFIDSEELAGANRGTFRNSITMLAQRLSDESRDREVIVLWAKADQPPDAGVAEQVKARLAKYLPGAQHIQISVKKVSRSGLERAAEAIVSLGVHPTCKLSLGETSVARDPFLRFRASHA